MFWISKLCKYWSLQYYADSAAAEQWMRERMPLAASDDFGKDEEGAQVCCSISFGFLI